MTFSDSTPISESWECYPAYHGLSLRQSVSGTTRFLPGDADDHVSDSVPLSFVLTDDEYESLTTKKSAGLGTAIAATYYGPTEQDKVSNEDFALAATVTGAKGLTWSFASVADGVSTKTFWAARTSRIACLVAFREFRSFVERAVTLTDEDLDHFRRSLTIALRGALEDERRLLLGRRAIPARWSAEYFCQYQDRDELWFNSTLIVAALGEWNGFVLWAGDGGIHLRKRNADRSESSDTIVMASKEDSRIDSCVSLRVAADQFRIARIGYDGSSHVEIYLGSDGVDRTLQRRRDGGYPKLSLRSGEDAARVLRELAASSDAERDNFSIARIGHDVSADVISTLAARNVDEPSRTPNEQALPLPLDLEPALGNVKAISAAGRTAAEQKLVQRGARLTVGVLPLLFFIFGGASGFIAGLFVMHWLHTLERPTAEIVRVRPNRTNSSSATMKRQPPQLVIDDAVRAALNNRTRAEPIRKLITVCVAAMKEQPDVYTLVAYADRSNTADLDDCKTNAKVALARSQTVAAWIQEQLETDKFAGDASILAAQRVCESPQSDIPVTDARARRLVLRRGRVANCECK